MGMKNFGVGISVNNNVEAVEFYKKIINDKNFEQRKINQ